MNVNTDFLIDILINEGHDAEELVGVLGITPEDIYERFRDKVWQHRREIYYGATTEEDADMEMEEIDATLHYDPKEY